MKVLISDPLAAEGVAILRDAGLEVCEVAGLPPDELRSTLADYDALIVRSGTKVTADVLQGAHRLKVIGRAGAGVDNIDTHAATHRGIVVMNTPGGNTVSACELTMAMMLALARRLPQASTRVKAGEWPRREFMGTELQGKQLGIVGLGRIGSEVARRAVAFDMHVVAFDPFLTDERARRLEVRPTTFDLLLATSDVITIHSPRNADTLGLIDAAAFQKMKPGVLLINCARGGIIDENALLKALQDGTVAGCALDVFQNEPPANSPLLALEQVIATPHVGATTREAQTNVATQIAHQIVEILRGDPPRNAVNTPALDPELYAILGPYIDLAQRLGRLTVQLAGGRIEALTVTYRGPMNEHDVRPLTAAVLEGLLQRALSTPVNAINAPIIAEELGIQVDVLKSTELEDFANLIAIDARTRDGDLSVAGTLFGRNAPRIVRIDNYHVDAAPTGHLLITRNQDQPGVIAHVSTVLAHRGVNVADMTCGRDRPGGTSTLVISIDNPVTPDIVRQIEASPLILKAQLVTL